MLRVAVTRPNLAALHQHSTALHRACTQHRYASRRSTHALPGATTPRQCPSTLDPAHTLPGAATPAHCSSSPSLSGTQLSVTEPSPIQVPFIFVYFASICNTLEYHAHTRLNQAITSHYFRLPRHYVARHRIAPPWQHLTMPRQCPSEPRLNHAVPRTTRTHATSRCHARTATYVTTQRPNLTTLSMALP